MCNHHGINGPRSKYCTRYLFREVIPMRGISQGDRDDIKMAKPRTLDTLVLRSSMKFIVFRTFRQSRILKQDWNIDIDQGTSWSEHRCFLYKIKKEECLPDRKYEMSVTFYWKQNIINERSWCAAFAFCRACEVLLQLVTLPCSFSTENSKVWEIRYSRIFVDPEGLRS